MAFETYSQDAQRKLERRNIPNKGMMTNGLIKKKAPGEGILSPFRRKRLRFVLTFTLIYAAVALMSRAICSCLPGGPSQPLICLYHLPWWEAAKWVETVPRSMPQMLSRERGCRMAR